MKKSRYTAEQIAFALRQAESGAPVLEVCRKMGVAKQTFYRWKKKFLGMGVAEVRRLKVLEEENRKLISPALATRRWSSKAIWMRSGWLRGSTYLVLLFWDRFSVSKPLSQIQRRTLLFLQQASYTPSFGGLGIKGSRHAIA